MKEQTNYQLDGREKEEIWDTAKFLLQERPEMGFKKAVEEAQEAYIELHKT